MYLIRILVVGPIRHVVPRCYRGCIHLSSGVCRLCCCDDSDEILVTNSAEVELASASWIGIFSASATAGTKLERERFDGAPGQACHY